MCDPSEKVHKTSFSDRMSRRLQQRLLELRAADTLACILHTPPPRCHELTGKSKGIFSVDLIHPFRLLFIPANDPIPSKEEGGLDLTKITEIEIIDIIDPH